MAQPAVRPFRINVPDEALVDLRRRILATRWPDKETVPDQSQGAQLAKIQALVRYWGTDYDWRKVEATLNALPQRVAAVAQAIDLWFLHCQARAGGRWKLREHADPAVLALAPAMRGRILIPGPRQGRLRTHGVYDQGLVRGEGTPTERSCGWQLRESGRHEQKCRLGALSRVCRAGD
jgi:hypothetical protein